MSEPELYPASWLKGTSSLPPYMERLAKHLYFEDGMPLEEAIVSAVSAVHHWCAQGTVSEATGTKVPPRTKAQACASTAQWRSLKAKSGSRFDEGRSATSDEELIRWVSQEIRESMTWPLIAGVAKDDDEPGLELTAEEVEDLRKFSQG